MIYLPPPPVVEPPAIIEQVGRNIAPDLGIAFAPGFRKPAPSAATLAFLGPTVAYPTDGQTITFSAVPIGAAAADRYVFIAIPYINGQNANYSIASVTIGGVLATIHAQPFNISAYARGGCALVSALVPTGTIATVVVNFAASGAGYYRLQLAVYRVTGLKSTTPYALVTDTNGPYAYPRSLNLNVVKDGFAIVAGYINPYGAGALSGITQDWKILPSASQLFIGGSNTINTTATLSVTLSGASTNADPALVMASFR